MKNVLLLMLFVCVTFLFTASSQKQKINKHIIGEWVNPYTYESKGEFKGFNFKKNGTVEAINVPSLDLKTWEIKNGKLCIEGFNIDVKTGERSTYSTSEKIIHLCKDSLRLLAVEVPRIAFLYINKESLIKSLKKNKSLKRR